MVSEISETIAAVSEQNGLEHFSKAKFRVKMISEISEAIGSESQTAHDLPDNLQNQKSKLRFFKFPEKTKMYKTHKKENC